MKLFKNSLLAILLIGLISCGSNQQPNNVSISQSQPQNISVQTAAASDIPGFNVEQFSNLLKTTTSPDALTQALNANGNNINNLDLDGDGNIDYLRVNQLDANTLQVVDETGASSQVVVATLNINTQNNSYSVSGNQTYCGNNYNYQSPTGLSFGQLMFISYMMSPHSYYHPYWGYHSHYYNGYSAYHSHYSRPYNQSYITERRTTTRTINRTTSSNAPRAQTPSVSTRSLSSPTQSQRSFQSNAGSGFKANNGNSNGFRPSASSSKSSFGSSRSSFGSSRSSFGSSRSGRK